MTLFHNGRILLTRYKTTPSRWMIRSPFRPCRVGNNTETIRSQRSLQLDEGFVPVLRKQIDPDLLAGRRVRPTGNVIRLLKSSAGAGRMIRRDGKNLNVCGKSYEAFGTRENACEKRRRALGTGSGFLRRRKRRHESKRGFFRIYRRAILIRNNNFVFFVLSLPIIIGRRIRYWLRERLPRWRRRE